jgi:uncharacterized membrane protein YecN with MAPEG domain
MVNFGVSAGDAVDRSGYRRAHPALMNARGAQYTGRAASGETMITTITWPQSVAVVTFYAGLNGLIALVLAILVIRQRQRTRTEFGTGGHRALEQAIRVQGNFVENVPLILILLLLLALGGLGPLWLHLLGIALTAGRILHAWGLSTNPGQSFGRSAGIALTWATLLVALALCLMRGAAMLAGGVPGGAIG